MSYNSFSQLKYSAIFNAKSDPLSNRIFIISIGGMCQNSATFFRRSRASRSYSSKCIFGEIYSCKRLLVQVYFVLPSSYSSLSAVLELFPTLINFHGLPKDVMPFWIDLSWRTGALFRISRHRVCVHVGLCTGIRFGCSDVQEMSGSW